MSVFSFVFYYYFLYVTTIFFILLLCFLFSKNHWLWNENKKLLPLKQKCEYILQHWEEHIILSACGRSLDSSYCVPFGEVLVEGRCRDFTALRRREIKKEVESEIKNEVNSDINKELEVSVSVVKYINNDGSKYGSNSNEDNDMNSNTNSNTNSGNDNNNTTTTNSTSSTNKNNSNNNIKNPKNPKNQTNQTSIEGYKFICLQNITPPTILSSIIQTVTVNISSLKDIIQSPLLYAKTSSFSMVELLRILKILDVSVIFCGDRVDDDVMYLLAAGGVSLVSIFVYVYFSTYLSSSVLFTFYIFIMFCFIFFYYFMV